MIDGFRDLRVTVMGLGRFDGGVGVTRWLAAQGARVLVTDMEPATKLSESLRRIADLGVTLHLGGHDERDFTDADLVVANPAVPERSEFLAAARRAGVPVTTELNLFVERCRGRTIGVTGSIGKSTTTAMIGHVLQHAQSHRRVWVGGNLGKSLLDSLTQIGESDWVVLELSSFQLERTPLVRWSPSIAVLTNLTPNHVDWHGTMAAYAAAKQNIFRFQHASGDAVVLHQTPALDETLRGASHMQRIWRYGVTDGVPAASFTANGATASYRWASARPGVPGAHNLENAAAALCVAAELGMDPSSATAALESFAGLEHRLQHVGTIGGVAYYNDSKATTPEAAITAMNAIDAPLFVILGGYDKEIDLSPAARVAAKRAKLAACIGQTGGWLERAITSAGGHARTFDTLESAFHACRSAAQVGDAILLSPACASWDMFTDYRERGERFTRLARESACTTAEK